MNGFDCRAHDYHNVFERLLIVYLKSANILTIGRIPEEYAMRIQNLDALLGQGNRQGRAHALEILDAGLDAADPLENTRNMLRLERECLLVGKPEFEPVNSPTTGVEIYDLSKIGNIYILGAGKGIQRVAKAIENLLGNRLTGGHVIDKKGHPIILQRIGVTLGSHPVPDQDCIHGCEQILDFTKDFRADDLVFLLVANGVSSLLTLPVPSISIEDVQKTTYLMQIERGAPTVDLNPIRNHLDLMKGGRISQHVHPAKMVHILAWHPSDYHQLMYRNLWLHTLPDYTTYQIAINNLRKWNAWNDVPFTVRRHLETADPRYETIKAHEFSKMSFRIFGVMPQHLDMISASAQKAQELGYTPLVLTRELQAEASQAGRTVAHIAKSIEQHGDPVSPPCVLLTGGELLVTVGTATGIGGRNQEFVLGAAQTIANTQNIVIAAADTDGTDGPGSQFQHTSGFPCLAGGIVDGGTLQQAKDVNINFQEELRNHNSSQVLLKLNSGMVISKGISMNDLSVSLIREKKH
jgi:glycerate-2-kinase